MEETPEEILARLQRYAELVRARPPAPAAPIQHAAPSWDGPHSPGRTATAVVTTERTRPTVVVENGDFDDITIEVVDEPEHSFGAISRAVAGEGLAVGVCIVTLVAWMNLSRGAAYIVIGTSAAALGAGLVRRVPFCGWCLVGVVAGFALGRFS